MNGTMQSPSGRDELRWTPDSLRSIGRLDFIANEVLDGVRQGLHRSIRRGFSTEFFDYRSYEPFDDASKIDWRLFAKTGKYYIKRFEAETSLECRIVADLSPSMAWSWKGAVSKREYCAWLGASLALLFVRQRDMVGLRTFGSGQESFLDPKSTRVHVENIYAVLGAPPSPPREDTGTRRSAALPDAVRGIFSTRCHKGLFILISDLEIPEEETAEAISLLRSRGDELVVFHLLDRFETAPELAGFTHLRDVETGELLRFDASVLKKHAGRVEAFRAFVRKYCEDAGALFLPVDTSSSPVRAILDMAGAGKGRL